MTELQIETLADDVLQAFGLTSVPVDLAKVASEENIALIEGDFDDDFHGRIEYLTEVQAFAIYHPSVCRSEYPPRIRFSIAHELGHYYIPYHRDLLLNGATHNSLEGFRHKNAVERQADSFAAALLVPTLVIKQRMGRRGFLSLAQILALAEDCNASAQATAFRYTRFTKEPHLAFVSEDGKILYSFASEEARVFGFASLRDKPVPDGTSTMKAIKSNGIVENKTEGSFWFQDRTSNPELWEEAIRLGNSNRILTLLSWVNYKA